MPIYHNYSLKELQEKVEQAFSLLKSCILCPKNCKIDRTSGKVGFCKTSNQLVVSSWGPHFGEESPLVGSNGSGTIFFTNCNLGCVFCQNYSISHLGEGSIITSDDLSLIMLKLQNLGCHNINLVTPTHQMPMILQGIVKAIEKGLFIPIVYNCGGYESLESLKILKGVVDIYMPDFKYGNSKNGFLYSRAKEYMEFAKIAIKEMYRQVGDLIIEQGIAKRGLIIRHLVLPENLADTEEVMKFISTEISRNTYVNIMDQYYPAYKAFQKPPLDRRITYNEYREAVEIAKKYGIYRIDGWNYVVNQYKWNS